MVILISVKEECVGVVGMESVQYYIILDCIIMCAVISGDASTCKRGKGLLSVLELRGDGGDFPHYLSSSYAL